MHEHPFTIRLENNFSTTALINKHLDSKRLHKRTLNRLQYRHDIIKDIQEHDLQILTQDNLTLKFEVTVKLNNLAQHSLPLDRQITFCSHSC